LQAFDTQINSARELPLARMVGAGRDAPQAPGSRSLATTSPEPGKYSGAAGNLSLALE
jgi:hypothetical protein